jgi:hypothetical protein
MGKYLDIIRKVETKQAESRKPTPTASSNESHALYRQTADTVRENYFAIDPHWLIDAHPQLWRRLVWLDYQTRELERRGETGPDYRQALEQNTATVKEAQALYEATEGKEALSS